MGQLRSLFVIPSRLVLLGAAGAFFVSCATDQSGPVPAGSICGNHVVEAGEECDDGNRSDGDGCSAFCGVETPSPQPQCGNGALEPGEQCDDGNNFDNDGCDASCAVESPTALCGNGLLEPGEQCDDGNLLRGDGCDAECAFEEPEPGCGNGVIEAGEQCDDGNTESGDGCDDSCAFETGTCGNGVLNAGEQCDDGNNTDGDGCDQDCELEGPVCGNSVLEAGEQCDDGNTASFDGCSSNCRTEACGDGVLQPGEQCDDGNNIDGDGCGAACVTETEPACGNGILEEGEQCDDGNNGDGDGCSSTCQDEPSGLCAADWQLSCGATDSWNTLYGGATDEVDSYSCVGWNESGPEYAYTFVATASSQVTLTLSGTSADLDLFLLAEAGGGCEQNGCIAYGDQSITFPAIAGALYYVVVDGYAGAQGPYSIAVECGGCGDGNLDAGEECDDGNDVGGDGCSADCREEYCGDGVVQDGGVGQEPGEECDDGNNADGDGCSADCSVESGGVCVPDIEAACGTYDVWSTSDAGSTDNIDEYACTDWDESGREYTYAFTPASDAMMTVGLAPEAGVDLDLFVLFESGTGCTPGNCIASGDNGATFEVYAGVTIYIVVDGYGGDEGAFTITFDCESPSQQQS